MLIVSISHRTEDEPENDDEEHTDRVMQIKEYFNVSVILQNLRLS